MDLSGVKALIVEDEPLLALEIEEMLESAGARVVGVATGCAAALSLIRTKHVSFAVLDVNLASETSQAVAEQLSVDGVPFVFYTSNTVRLDWMKAPVVAKPSGRDVLLASLAAAVDSHYAHGAKRHNEASC